MPSTARENIHQRIHEITEKIEYLNKSIYGHETVLQIEIDLYKAYVKELDRWVTALAEDTVGISPEKSEKTPSAADVAPAVPDSSAKYEEQEKPSDKENTSFIDKVETPVETPTPSEETSVNNNFFNNVEDDVLETTTVTIDDEVVQPEVVDIEEPVALEEAFSEPEITAENEEKPPRTADADITSESTEPDAEEFTVKDEEKPEEIIYAEVEEPVAPAAIPENTLTLEEEILNQVDEEEKNVPKIAPEPVAEAAPEPVKPEAEDDMPRAIRDLLARKSANAAAREEASADSSVDTKTEEEIGTSYLDKIKQIHAKVTPEPNATLNDRFKKEKPELFDSIKQDSVKDMRDAIDLNERFQFINDLFNGDVMLYNKVLNDLNAAGSRNQAMQLVEMELQPKPGWKKHEDIAQRFMTKVNKKYPS